MRDRYSRDILVFLEANSGDCVRVTGFRHWLEMCFLMGLRRWLKGQTIAILRRLSGNVE